MKKKVIEPIKLDLSFSEATQEGYVRRELKTLPDASVSDIFCAFRFQRIPGKDRGAFMDECHRVLVAGGKMTVIVPYWSSVRAIQDYEHEWPPVVENSFMYFNRAWREAQKDPRKLKCDFDFVFGYMWEQDTATRSEELRASRVKLNLNAVTDVQLVLTKRG